MKLPNFFVAGAPKAGTTSLYHYLAQHPQVFMSPIKEPSFFAAADLLTKEPFRRRLERDRVALQPYLAGPQTPLAALRAETLYVREWTDYVRLFRNARDEAAIGEASPAYLWLPSAAAAIRAKVPAARLIFILRDPAARLFSWYLRYLRFDSQITFRAWFQRELSPGEERWSSLDGGRYATHLQRFVEIFPADQMRIYLFEELRDAGAVLRDAFAFLGVDPEHPVDTSSRHNETVVPRFPHLHRLRRKVFGDGPIASWLPAGVRPFLRLLYHRRRGAFAMSADDRRMVIEYYRDEILRTATLINRDLSAWLR